MELENFTILPFKKPLRRLLLTLPARQPLRQCTHFLHCNGYSMSKRTKRTEKGKQTATKHKHDHKSDRNEIQCAGNSSLNMPVPARPPSRPRLSPLFPPKASSRECPPSCHVRHDVFSSRKNLSSLPLVFHNKLSVSPADSHRFQNFI